MMDHESSHIWYVEAKDPDTYAVNDEWRVVRDRRHWQLWHVRLEANGRVNSAGRQRSSFALCFNAVTFQAALTGIDLCLRAVTEKQWANIRELLQLINLGPNEIAFDILGDLIAPVVAEMQLTKSTVFGWSLLPPKDREALQASYIEFDISTSADEKRDVDGEPPQDETPRSGQPERGTGHQSEEASDAPINF
jgi:hypothetical protein